MDWCRVHLRKILLPISHALISDNALSDIWSQFLILLGPCCMACVRGNLLSWSSQPSSQHYHILQLHDECKLTLLSCLESFSLF